MLLKCCTQYASKFKKLSSGHKIGKGILYLHTSPLAFIQSFQSQRKAMPKSVHYCIIALISHASKVMLKILQARLQQYINHELPDV